jgi:hypothetical protein
MQRTSNFEIYCYQGECKDGIQSFILPAYYNFISGKKYKCYDIFHFTRHDICVFSQETNYSIRNKNMILYIYNFFHPLWFCFYVIFVIESYLFSSCFTENKKKVRLTMIGCHKKERDDITFGNLILSVVINFTKC